jgi:hypothetical protein
MSSLAFGLSIDTSNAETTDSFEDVLHLTGPRSVYVTAIREVPGLLRILIIALPYPPVAAARSRGRGRPDSRPRRCRAACGCGIGWAAAPLLGLQ